MRANPTPAEARLGEVLKMLGFEFQVPICGWTKNGGRWDYILDALHFGTKICVEVDGSAHDKRKGRDRRRTERLRAEYGITVIRFTNNQVLRHRNEVVVAILDRMEELRDGQ